LIPPIPFQPINTPLFALFLISGLAHAAPPVLSLIQAALQKIDPDMIDETIAVPETWPSDHFALRVNGRSMKPDYADGSSIICRRLKPGEYARTGDDVIARDASDTHCKRRVYTKDGKKGDAPRKALPRLVSLNPHFPEVVPVADCPIIAVVVGKA
jgi:SOS-response transcriptional repressor LexA